MAGLLQGKGDAEPRPSLTHLQGSSRLLELRNSPGGGEELGASFPWAAWLDCTVIDLRSCLPGHANSRIKPCHTVQEEYLRDSHTYMAFRKC